MVFIGKALASNPVSTLSVLGRPVALVGAIAISGSLLAFAATPAMATSPAAASTLSVSAAPTPGLAGLGLAVRPQTFNRATADQAVTALVRFATANGLSLPPAGTPVTAADVQLLVENGVRAFIASPTAGKVVGTLVTDLVAASGSSSSSPHLRCLAAKDPTGLAPTVLLSLLGADPAAVAQGFASSATAFLSAPAVQSALAAALPALPAPADVLSQLPSFAAAVLQAGLDQVTISYGTLENYAVQGLGLSPRTLQILKAKFLASQPL